MNPDGDRAYFKARPTGRETTLAVQVQLTSNDRQFWIPRSVCEWHRDGILTVEQWFADREGMEDE